jgi:cobalamin biosynthesis Co2+ chelatase CbiK
MTVRYSKIFTVIGAISHEPVTILVERIEAEGYQGVTIESLEGEYPSVEDFEKETEARSDKIYNLLPLMLIDTRQFADTLKEALHVSD